MIPPSAFPNPDLATILVANRGEIACRILATIRAMGLRGVAIYSEADRDARHVAMADEAYCVGPPAVAESYLDIDRILEVARRTGSQAIHPGYGLLSENVTFAQACQEAGVAFIGPRPEQIDCFGLKDRARAIAREQGVPLLEGTELLRTEGAAFAAAGRIGYPVILKAAAGGGGIGMQRCDTLSELREAYASVGRLAESNFGSADVFLEKFIVNARHIEVQVFGDGEGKVCVLGERDCSTQRRNQKVIEETPAPGLPQAKREECWECARRLAAAVDYRSAGTVEFLYDADEEQFYFLEVNTRLQVEHGVTEMVTHVDLVGWMIRLALGDNPIAEEPLSLPVEGHAIEVRIYAEDPHKDFQPSSGLLTQVSYPPEVRSDYWVESGTEVTPFYDPLLAKVLVNAGTREEAVGKLKQALAQTEMAGIETNLLYLRQIVAWERFGEGGMTTRALGEFHFEPATIDVLSAGIQTTIQDYPGRVGYWNVGVPPSGPMDSLSFRLLNRLVGNEEGVAGLEMTMSGPTLRFNRACCIALGGAEMGATLDGQAVESWSTIAVTAGQILAVGTAEGLGARGYLVVSGGLEVPEYLGSRSTFILGQFGGHGGRALRVGDVLHLGSPPGDGAVPPSSLAPAVIPVLTHEWEIGVMYGPHGAPDFFKVEDLEMILGTAWEVHHHSARTGLRLVGPKPSWARSDGGEAGLHPSNIHDNAYAFGTLDFTGDMPVILGPDGPSLGGFVCPVTIVQSELWKTGQLRPGDKVRFFLLSQEAANQREKALDAVVASLEGTVALSTESRIQVPTHSGVVKELPQEEGAPQVVFRAAGDRFLLMEFGPLELDLALRFKVQAVFERLRREAIEGVIDLTPGIRSLQVHYDSRVLSLERLIEQIEAVEEGLTKTEEVEVPSRIVHLPLAWDDEETQKAIQKYVTTVNPEAPWCPSNIEFIRRINGLATQEEV
ncbi:MAG: urea carboxylase, partial [Verrucomicrobiota bacterium]